MDNISKNKIQLVPITDLNKESLLLIRNIRQEDQIRKWMYTDHLISDAEHLSWIESLRNDKKQIVFAVMGSNIPLGVISVNDIDVNHKKADWAFYLSNKAQAGLGSILEYFFIDFIFNNLKIEKLNCEVIEGNETVIKLHKKFSFKEEGFRESNIIKENNRIGVHFLGLTKDLWIKNKESLNRKYGRIFKMFEIDILYKN